MQSSRLDRRHLRGGATARVVAIMSTSTATSERQERTGWERAPEGLRWRMGVSILAPIVWLSVTLLYVGFWASGFTLFQSVIVILVSTLILGGVMGTAWMAWGPRYRHAWD